MNIQIYFSRPTMGYKNVRPFIWCIKTFLVPSYQVIIIIILLHVIPIVLVIIIITVLIIIFINVIQYISIWKALWKTKGFYSHFLLLLSKCRNTNISVNHFVHKILSIFLSNNYEFLNNKCLTCKIWKTHDNIYVKREQFETSFEILAINGNYL